ncbi:MAG: hypothetical protein IPF52_03690 [Saprospiraceae bacterium]|nr:hypothetical protein [Saprospiraceae bacterium]
MTFKSKRYFYSMTGVLIACGILFLIWCFIEIRNHNYLVVNEKGKEINAIIISDEELLRIKFMDLNPGYFITIVKKKNIIGVNGTHPIKFINHFYFFTTQAKQIDYTDGVHDLFIGTDTIKFNSFRFNDMDLKNLGKKIIIIKK